MSKYTDMAALASKDASTWFEKRRKCQIAAGQFVSRFKSFLDAPEEMVSYVELNSDLLPTNKEEPFPGLPPLTEGIDGRFYFGLRIRWKLLEAISFGETIFMIGISLVDDGIAIYFDPEEFKVKSESDLESAMSYIFDETKKRYAIDPSQRKRHPGFIG